MKFWDWTWWRIGKQYKFNPEFPTDNCKVNGNKWVRVFRGYFVMTSRAKSS